MYVINKKFMLLFITFMLVGIGAVLFAAHARSSHTLNCTQLRAIGKVNIPEGSKDYTPLLDRDHDGFACDA